MGWGAFGSPPLYQDWHTSCAQRRHAVIWVCAGDAGAERTSSIRNRCQSEWATLSRLPPHPCIQRVLGAFESHVPDAMFAALSDANKELGTCTRYYFLPTLRIFQGLLEVSPCIPLLTFPCPIFSRALPCPSPVPCLRVSPPTMLHVASYAHLRLPLCRPECPRHLASEALPTECHTVVGCALRALPQWPR